MLDRAPGRHLGASQCMAVRQSGLCFPSRVLNSRGAGAPTHSGRGNIFPDEQISHEHHFCSIKIHSAPRIYKHNGRKCQTCTIRPLAALVLCGYRNRCSGQHLKAGDVVQLSSFSSCTKPSLSRKMQLDTTLPMFSARRFPLHWLLVCH